MINVEYTGGFSQKLKGLLAKNSSLRSSVEKNVALFRKNPDDTRLSNHALHKRLSGKWAFSVTDDIRIIYSFTGKKSVRFLAIGTHAAVYRKNKLKNYERQIF